jgi:L-lactate dehydrogenase
LSTETPADRASSALGALPRGILVAGTDPPDPLADLTRALARHDRVLSTGTTIDTLRFRVHVAGQLAASTRRRLRAWSSASMSPRGLG